MDTNETHKRGTAQTGLTHPIGRKALLWIATIALVVGMALYVVSYRAEAKRQTEAKRVTAAEYAAAHPPTPIIVKTGRERTSYSFGSDGCVTIFLRGNWSSYPQGGKIVFISPITGETLVYDEPGKKSGSSLPAGDYKICKVDPSAWGVEIWQ